MATPTRLEIRAGGRVVYSQDVFDYKLRMDNSELTLTASHSALAMDSITSLKFTDNPAFPPTPTPGAPDGDDEPTAPDEPVIEQVHTGERAASRKERRAAASEVTSEVTVHPPGTVVDDVPSSVMVSGLHGQLSSRTCSQLVRHHNDLPETEPSGE